MKSRLDAELVRRGLARSRDIAAQLIESGQVLVNGIAASKAATGVDWQTSIKLKDENKTKFTLENMKEKFKLIINPFSSTPQETKLILPKLTKIK